MKMLRGISAAVLTAGFILGLCLVWKAQGQNLRNVSSQPIPITSQLQAVSSVPPWGNFYLLSQAEQAFPPLPFNPYAAQGAVVYALGQNSFLIDDSSVTNPPQAMSAGRMSAMDVGSDSDSTLAAPVYGSNDLWLEITNVSADVNLSYLVVHPPWNAETPVYDLFSTTNLLPSVPGLNGTNWMWVMRTGPGQTNLTVTNLPAAAQFFMLATTNDTDGDGLSDAFEELVSHSNPNNASTIGGGLPDLWIWNNFGAAGFNLTPDSDYDGDGMSISYEYSHGIDPNKIQFNMQFANLRVNANTATGIVSVVKGVPFQMATLMDSTNFAAASWVPYNSTLVISLGSTDGAHDVWIGLKGRAENSIAMWEDWPMARDTTPPLTGC